MNGGRVEIGKSQDEHGNWQVYDRVMGRTSLMCSAHARERADELVAKGALQIGMADVVDTYRKMADEIDKLNGSYSRRSDDG